MLNLVRIVLFPLAFFVAMIDACYNIFWYCVIIGRPKWIREHETPIRELRDLLRDSTRGAKL